MTDTVSISWHQCNHLRLQSWTAVKVKALQVQQLSYHLCSAVRGSQQPRAEKQLADIQDRHLPQC